MLVNLERLYKRALKGKFAIPHFNVYNLETALWVVKEAEVLNSPVILAYTSGAFKFATREALLSASKAIAIKSSTEVVLHLDHHLDIESIKEGIKYGATSAMIDASMHSLDKNIEATKEVIEYAIPRGVSVEAEVGALGGKEDDLEHEGTGLAKVEDVEKFIKNTDGLSALAVAIGNAHGFYVGEPKLRFDLLEKICQKCDEMGVIMPLVLHGGTGIPDSDLRKSMEYRMGKINIGTRLKKEYAFGLRDYFKDHPEEISITKINTISEKKYREVVREKILVCKSNS